MKKITQKQLKNYNSGKDSTFNEEYNKANDLPTLEQRALLNAVKMSLFGYIGKTRNITQKDIMEYVEIGPYLNNERLKNICQSYRIA